VTAVREFVVARNPEEGSSLPYLVRLPLPDGAVVLKVRDVWPRTAKVYCHRAVEWPQQPEIVERVPVHRARPAEFYYAGNRYVPGVAEPQEPELLDVAAGEGD